MVQTEQIVGKQKPDLRLSIIVPVYNVEKYLARCLNSLLEQDLPPDQYEILVIDDESPDGSRAIAEQFADEHEQIRVICQKNLGLGGARNTGIKQASGKYLMFVDSDDYIEPNSIGILVDIAENKCLEILRFGYREETEEDPEVINQNIEECQLSPILTGEEFMAEWMKVACYACVLVIRTDLLKKNDLYFVKHRYYEDTEWFPRVLLKTEQIADYDMIVYHYVQRKGSITKAVSLEKKQKVLNDKLLLIEHLQRLKKQVKLRGAIEWFDMMIAHLVISIINYALRFVPDSMNEIKQILTKKNIYPLFISRLSKKNSLYIILINFNINIYIIIRKLFLRLKLQ